MVPNARLVRSARGDMGSAMSRPSRTMNRFEAFGSTSTRSPVMPSSSSKRPSERRIVQRAVRTGLVMEAVAFARADHAARCRRCLDDCDSKPAALQPVRRDEAGKSRADDDDVEALRAILGARIELIGATAWPALQGSLRSMTSLTPVVPSFTGDDVPSRSPDCGVALPDFEIRAPTMTSL